MPRPAPAVEAGLHVLDDRDAVGHPGERIASGEEAVVGVRAPQPPGDRPRDQAEHDPEPEEPEDDDQADLRVGVVDAGGDRRRRARTARRRRSASPRLPANTGVYTSIACAPSALPASTSSALRRVSSDDALARDRLDDLVVGLADHALGDVQRVERHVADAVAQADPEDVAALDERLAHPHERGALVGRDAVGERVAAQHRTDRRVRDGLGGRVALVEALALEVGAHRARDHHAEHEDRDEGHHHVEREEPKARALAVHPRAIDGAGRLLDPGGPRIPRIWRSGPRHRARRGGGERRVRSRRVGRGDPGT